MRISISITNNQYNWLKKNARISPSGLFQEAIEKMMNKNLYEYKQRIKNEIEERLRRSKLKLRPHLKINDIDFSLGPPYPIEDIEYIVNEVKKIDKQVTKQISTTNELPGEMTLNHPTLQRRDFVKLKVFRHSDNYNDPIVDFFSQFY